MCSQEPDNPFVVAALLPADAQARLAGALGNLESLDRRIRVVTAVYDEGQDLRTVRSRDGAVAARSQPDPSVLDALARARVALALDLPSPIRQFAPRLEWVQALGSGVGHLRSAGLAAAGIRLTNAAGTASGGIAEFVLARILQVAKQLRSIDDAQALQAWQPVFGASLAGRTIALIGLGGINGNVARLAKAFSMRVLATYRSARAGQQRDSVDEVFALDDLMAMVRQADILVSAVPEDASTMGLISQQVLDALPGGAIICNVGRGSAVDELALIRSLHSGHLGAAVLDVSAREPLPPGDPLWSAPNLYYSAHCAVVLEQLLENVHRLFTVNLQRFLAGQPLLNEVVP
jgi:phosphoglycerate dehydrogenase-like enzyme